MCIPKHRLHCLLSLLLLLLLAPLAEAQLTREQKLADFNQLAAIYAKNYKPYEWKLTTFGFDLFYLKPWLDQVEASKDDLEFYDICVRYVASFRDSHDEFFITVTDFVADLPIGVDLWGGKLLIEGIDRSVLPFSKFPFFVGDEVVSVDGKSVEAWISELIPYAANGSGNDAARRRLAADTIVNRFQYFYPLAPRVPEFSTVVIRGFDGELTPFEIPWRRSGTPILSVGPVPSPQSVRPESTVASNSSPRVRPSRHTPNVEGTAAAVRNPWDTYSGPAPDRMEETVPSYLRALRDLQTSGALESTYGAVGFGYRDPVFDPPPGFVRRIGGSAADQILTGTFPLGNYRVGFIRLPTMSPANPSLALSQFVNEIAYFNANTRGLVIDVMHNGGGDLCFVETLFRYLNTRPFRGVTYEIRATEYWTAAFSSSLSAAKRAKADQWVIDLYSNYVAQVEQARMTLRASTGDLPVCTPAFEAIPPAVDRNGNGLAYSRPILVLVNEFSLSAAESFAGLLQDEGRVTVLGTRTSGGGGNPATYNAGTYSMGSTRVTRTLVTRGRYVKTPDLPPANHFENLGVYPDYWEDFQTEANFNTYGRPFVEAFTAVMADLIAKAQP